MTEEDIFQAGYEAAAQASPMPDDVVNRLAVILAPLADQPAPAAAKVKSEERAA